MKKAEIVAEVNEVLAEEFEVELEEITPEGSLVDTLMIDSLDLVDVVVLIESNFGITIVAEDFVGVKTFEDFYNLIARKLNVES